jgi:hypothetical protein
MISDWSPKVLHQEVPLETEPLLLLLLLLLLKTN